MATKPRRKPTSSGREIVRAYDDAIRRERREGHTLTPKEFLDIVAPSKRGRSEASSARYLRKLRSGERSGASLYKRSFADGGRRVSVAFKDTETGVVESANVQLPYGSSRLDLFKPSLKNKRRSRLRIAMEDRIRTTTSVPIDPHHMRYLGARSIKTTKKGSEKVR